MGAPLAYFLTWTTSGTRLHGDERGSVDRQHNRPGDPLLARDDARAEGERRAMAFESLALEDQARAAAAAAIREHATRRGWRISALSVRSNHVHVVVEWGPKQAPAPELVVRSLKGWATRRLRAEGCVVGARPIWTRHASTRWLNTHDDPAKAIEYVEEMQEGVRRRRRERP